MSESPATGGQAEARLQLRVRRARLADAADYARILSHGDVFPQTLQLPYADEDLWRGKLAEMLAPGRNDLLLVGEISVNDGPWQVQGAAGLHPVGASLRVRHAMAVSLAVHPDWQGRGLGWALLTALIDYADRWAGVLRLQLHVYADNTRAIRLYEGLGFVTEGRLRGESLRDGLYVDTLTMARWHPQPPALAVSSK